LQAGTVEILLDGRRIDASGEAEQRLERTTEEVTQTALRST
jgi:hypothetical protein